MTKVSNAFGVSLPNLLVSKSSDEKSIYIGGQSDVAKPSFGGSVIAELKDGCGHATSADAFFPATAKNVTAQQAAEALVKSMKEEGVNATANQVGGADTPDVADDLYQVTVLEDPASSQADDQASKA